LSTRRLHSPPANDLKPVQAHTGMVDERYWADREDGNLETGAEVR
jgi:hypothetical protein